MSMASGQLGTRCCVIALVVSLMLVAVHSQPFYQMGRYGKRAEALRVSRADERFFGGPRFGRSGGDLSAAPIDVQVRNPERFFIGSRYGKRSEIEEHTIDSPVETAVADAEHELKILRCQFTGIGKLFYCEEETIVIPEDKAASSDDQQQAHQK